MRNSTDVIIICVIAGAVVLVLIVRALARANANRRDPLVDSMPGRVVAVDLHLSRLGRFQPNDHDPLRARAIVERVPGGAGGWGDTGAAPTLACDWRPASGLNPAVKSQVFTSSWVINETFPNLRISDRAQRAAAVAQMQLKDQHYRFALPEPVPVTIRESKSGRFQIDF